LKGFDFPPGGGIKRYENDNYIGGNPWVLATLWVALYYIEIKEYEKAKDYLRWRPNPVPLWAFAGAGEQGQRRALLGNTSYMVPRHVCIVLAGLKEAGFYNAKTKSFMCVRNAAMKVLAGW